MVPACIILFPKRFWTSLILFFTEILLVAVGRGHYFHIMDEEIKAKEGQFFLEVQEARVV